MAGRNSLKCCVCGKPGVEAPTFDRDDPFSLLDMTSRDARDRVVMNIMVKLSKNGSFAVGGIQEFWLQFEDRLCDSCRVKLHSLARDDRKQQALELLEEAVRLDPGNDVANQNLAAVRRMI